jgi:hypothetical protein
MKGFLVWVLIIELPIASAAIQSGYISSGDGFIVAAITFGALYIGEKDSSDDET